MTTTMAAATTPAPACGLATKIAAAENASPDAAGQPAPYATHPNPTKETIPMTDDQTEALTNEQRVLPVHRTEAGYPNCSTCDGGGCPDCTDPA